MNTRNHRQRLQNHLLNEIRNQITDGLIQPGEHLPSERKLAENYSVSVRSVRQALISLEREGIISRQHGRGTIVLPVHQGPANDTKQNSIALFFIGRIRDTSTMEYFEAFQNACQRGGYGTLVYTSDNDPAEETRLVEQLVREGIPGIALFSAHLMNSYAHLEAAQAAGVKVAVFDHDFPGLNCTYVGIDEFDAAYRATLHLMNLGCDDLIYIDSDWQWTSVRNRCKGFQAAVAKHNSLVRSRILKVKPFANVEEQIQSALPSLLHEAEGRVGVVAYNDRAALGALDSIKATGLTVPDDIAVMGFADDLEGAISGVPLTTMQIPRAEIAQLAAYLLMHQIQQPNQKSQKVEMTANLMIRSSCGAYPRRLDLSPHDLPKAGSFRS